MARPREYSEELLDRGVRLVFESGRPIAHVARDLGISSEVLRKRVRQAEADNGSRPDLPTSAEREEIRKLRRENYELRRANEILKSASVYCACGGRTASRRSGGCRHPGRTRRTPRPVGRLFASAPNARRQALSYLKRLRRPLTSPPARSSGRCIRDTGRSSSSGSCNARAPKCPPRSRPPRDRP